jgi:hypothetical protein
MTDEAPPLRTLASTGRLFLMAEYGLYTSLGVLLAIVAVVALVHAGADVLQGVLEYADTDRIFASMDELLFVLMLVEILHTVRVSIRSGTLNGEPFLIVGLIASIRRVLVITLESSKATQNQTVNDTAAVVFRNSMVELVVLGILILVMVVSIFMLRRAARGAE